MVHPLIQKLIDERGYPEITSDNHDAFVAQPGVKVLFFAGDPKQHRESTDVAVVLPELVEAFDRQFEAGVVADFTGVALNLQRRYGFGAWPALVFVRDGCYLGAITRVRNWVEYLETIAELLRREPGDAPGRQIPLVHVDAIH